MGVLIVEDGEASDLGIQSSMGEIELPHLLSWHST